jgi:hypothetical protein
VIAQCGCSKQVGCCCFHFRHCVDKLLGQL